jgi:hypothetical protein
MSFIFAKCKTFPAIPSLKYFVRSGDLSFDTSRKGRGVEVGGFFSATPKIQWAHVDLLSNY